MRNLTKKQKTLLLKWANEHPNEMRKSHSPVDLIDCDLWDEIVAINDTEVLYQNANRFLEDLEWNWEYTPNEKLSFSLPK